MPVNDPIADMLTRMRNAQHARKEECLIPHSRIKKSICDLLKAEGYLQEVEVIGQEPKRQILVTFVPGKLLTLERKSKPGRRQYVDTDNLRPVLHGHGVAILSTSHGVITDKEARKKKTGGELLCTIS